MRLSSALPLLAATATASLAFDFPPLHRRDASPDHHHHHLDKRATPLANLVITDLNNLTELTRNITAAIVATTDLTSALAITTANNNLIAGITKAQADVSSDPADLTDTDAQALGPPTQYLAYAANASIANLIRKKDLFASLNVVSIVNSSLHQQIDASNAFSAILLAKIPANIRPVADALNGQVDTSLQMGIDCFNGMNQSCSTAIADPHRTADAAMDSGAIPKSPAGGRSAGEVGGLLAWGAVVAVAVLFAA